MDILSRRNCTQMICLGGVWFASGELASARFQEIPSGAVVQNQGSKIMVALER